MIWVLFAASVVFAPLAWGLWVLYRQADCAAKAAATRAATERAAVAATRAATERAAAAARDEDAAQWRLVLQSLREDAIRAERGQS